VPAERIDVQVQGSVIRLTLNRPDRRNALDALVIDELDAALDMAERSPDCRVIVLAARGPAFCTGMDVAGAARDRGGDTAQRFFTLLRRFTVVPRTVVCVVDGQVTGGGVGLIAAADLTYSTTSSSFGLPEALWGLLPCCVLPFLIRRVGFQQAYSMSLTTLPLSADEARLCRLVDAVDDEPEALLRRLFFRAEKIAPDLVGDLKRYTARLQPVTPETERAALTELSRLASSPRVRRHLDDFATHGRFPWETADNTERRSAS
jgi:polyketide biosynthesis enoyl-CoA hydratase PksH